MFVGQRPKGCQRSTSLRMSRVVKAFARFPSEEVLFVVAMSSVVIAMSRSLDWHAFIVARVAFWFSFLLKPCGISYCGNVPNDAATFASVFGVCQDGIVRTIGNETR